MGSPAHGFEAVEAKADERGIEPFEVFTSAKVDRVIGDPHWHVHTTIANMTHAQYGKSSTVAAGGRDLMRHAPAADHILKALIRRTLTVTYGVAFTRSERTGGWEVAAIPDATLREFSKRGASIEAMLTDLGFDPKQATRRAEDLAAAQTRHGQNACHRGTRCDPALTVAGRSPPARGGPRPTRRRRVPEAPTRGRCGHRTWHGAGATPGQRHHQRHRSGAGRGHRPS